MSIEVEQLNHDGNNLIDAVDEVPPNIINDNDNNDGDLDEDIGGGNKRIDLSRESSPSLSNSSHSSTSLDLDGRTRNGKRNKHPLSSSYKEWLHNWFQISIPAIGFLGCQLSLALQNGFVTPELEELGISEKLVGYCWLAPPLTGYKLYYMYDISV